MKLSTAEAAKILECSIEHLHWGMRQGAYNPPIGTAVKSKGGTYSYNIHSSMMAKHLNKHEWIILWKLKRIRAVEMRKKKASKSLNNHGYEIIKALRKIREYTSKTKKDKREVA